MQTSMKDIVKNAMVDVSGYSVELVDGRFKTVGDDLTAHLVQLVADGDGLAVCHGAGPLLAKHGMDIHHEQDAAVARDYLESIFRAFAAAVDVSQHSPVVIGYDRVAAMDVDGYNKNTSFTPNSDHTESREFLTTKCVHFDSATPFIGNVYGPNTNIDGGKPIVCNTRDFCATAGVDPAELIELMPHSYNVAVKEQYAGRHPGRLRGGRGRRPDQRHGHDRAEQRGGRWARPRGLHAAARRSVPARQAAAAPHRVPVRRE